MKKTKIRSLQALRFYACAVIYIYHAKIDFLGPNAYLVCSNAVILFFILAGFVSALSRWESYPTPSTKDCVRLLKTRLSAPYLLHLFMLVAVMLVKLFQEIHGFAAGWNVTWKMVFTNLTLTQSWIPPYFCLNGAAWFLSDMAFFYLLTPLLLWLLNKIASPLALFVLALLSCEVQPAVTAAVSSLLPQVETYAFPPCNLPLYFAGLCLGGCYRLAAQKPSFTDRRVWRACGSLAGIVLFVICFHATDIIPAPALAHRTVLCALLIFALAQECSPVHTLIGNPLFVHLGNISMEIYLTHLVGIWSVDAILEYLWKHGIYLYPLRKWGRLFAVLLMAELAHRLLPKLLHPKEKKPTSSKAAG